MRRSTFYNWVITLLVVGLVLSWAWFLFGGSLDLTGSVVVEEIVEEVEEEEVIVGVEQGFSDGAYYLGGMDAPVVVEIFSDFQCSYCKSAWNVLKQIEEDYVNIGQVRFVFNHLPLSFHEEAENAALAVMCAGEQEKFWSYHDGLFESQDLLGESFYYELAEELELDYDTFEECYNSKEYYGLVRMNMAYAASKEISGTPAFLINDELVTGALDYDSFIMYIEKHL